MKYMCLYNSYKPNAIAYTHCTENAFFASKIIRILALYSPPHNIYICAFKL